MIHCTKCHTANPSDQLYCQNCHKNLLPGESLGTRIAYLVAAGLVTALGVFVLMRISQGGTLPDLGCAFTSPVFWVILVVLTPITGLVYALRRTPPYQRYLDRAKRHIQLDPQQALADLNRALELAPAKAQAEVLKERAKVYQALGQSPQATRDQLASTQAEGAFQGSAALASLAGIDGDTFVDGVRSNTQEGLLKSGEVQALGYCSKCKDVADLDEKLRCKQHRRAKIKEIRFATSGDRDMTRLSILGSYQDMSRSLRRRRLVAGVAILISLPLLYFYFYKGVIAPAIENVPLGITVTDAPTAAATPAEQVSEPTPAALPAANPSPQATQPPTAAPTVEPVVLKATVLSETINVRAGPGKDYDPVGVLAKGDEIDVHGQNTAGDWLCLASSSPGQEWVYARLVSVSGETASLPVIDPEP